MKKKKATQICRMKSRDWKCKDVSGDNKQQLCDKHFEQHKEFLARNPSVVSEEKRRLFGIDTPFLTKKKDLPPDELRCCVTGGNLWRCKNVRMGIDAAEDDNNSNVRKSRYCRHHYTYNVERQKNNGKNKGKKKRSEGAVDTCTEGGYANIGTKRKSVERTESSGGPKSLTKSREAVVETSDRSNCSKRRKMVTEDERFVDEIRIEPATDDTYDSATERWRKLFSELEKRRKKTVVAEGDRPLEVDETGTQLPATTTSDKSESEKEFGFANIIGTKRNKNKEKDKKEKELPPDEQRCVKTSGTGWRCKNAEDTGNVPKTSYCQQHYNHHADRYAKNKKSADGEAEGGGAGCTTNCSYKLRKRVVSEDDPFLDETRTQPATINDTSDSDSTFIANIGTKRNEVMEDDLSFDQTGIQLTPSRTSDSDKSTEGGSANIGTKRKTVERTECSGELESLTINKDPVVELESLEHYKSECVKLALDLETKKMECTNLQVKLAELDIRMTIVTDESKRALADATECWGKMQSDLESRFLRMEKEKSTTGCLESRILNLENIVLRMDNLNSTMAGSVESRLLKLESLALMSNWNKSTDKEMKWKVKADMLSSFEKDPELCMKAVCALYRLLISEDEASDKQLFIPSDTLRVTELAEFLMDGDCNGDLKKSVKDLEIFDLEAIKDCKKLARRYSDPLFSVYQNGEDPYFLPPTTAMSNHGYPTSK